MIKSVYENQEDILKSIHTLYCPHGFDIDLTYGKGGFWKNIPELRPFLCCDINPRYEYVRKEDSTDLSFEDEKFNSVVFDPPFLTYIKPGNNSIMAKQFSGYWRYDELQEHYEKTISEAERVLVKKGFFIFKCQDIIHNHKMHCTHNWVINICDKYNFSLRDLFILAANKRLPAPNKKGKQKHARIFHSYFLVSQKN